MPFCALSAAKGMVIFMAKRNISEKDIKINCIFKDNGEDVSKIIEQSFYCYVKKEIAKKYG